MNTVPGKWGGDHFFVQTVLRALMIKLCGLSLWSVRATSVVVGWFGLWGMVKIAQYFKLRPVIVFLLGFFFLSSNIVFILCRWGRPEILVLVFSVWSLYFLLMGIKTKSFRHFFYTGVFLWLSILSHPHGLGVMVVFSLFTLLYVLRTRQWRSLKGFSLSFVVMGLIFYGFIMMHFPSLTVFLQDILTEGKMLSGDTFFGVYMENLNQFIVTYSLGWKRAFILIVELGVLFIGLFFRKEKPIFYLSCGGLLTFLFSLGLFFFRRRYFGIVLFFSILVGVLIIQYLMKKNNRKALIFACVIACLYGVNNGVGDSYIMYKNRHTTPFSYVEKELRQSVPRQARVLSHLHFWTALSHTTMTTMSRMNLNEFRTHYDYLVITDRFSKAISPTTGEANDFHNTKTSEISTYNKVYKLLNERDVLVKNIYTKGYGVIQVWKLTKGAVPNS